MKLSVWAILVACACLLAGCRAGTNTTTAIPEQTPFGALQVWCFQAGKADAFLFWNEAGAVLLDTGESGFGKTILEKLAELGIQRLDYLIVTHFDKDHVGGAKKILSEIQVGTVLQSNSPKSGAEAYEKYLSTLASKGIEPVTVREKMEFRLGEATFTVDPPAAERYAEDASNNSSLILTVAQGDTRILFCGDAEDLRLAEFLQDEPGQFDLVKLPHHGQYQATLEALLAQTLPAYAVITSSEEEREDEQTMALLAKYGVKALLTREHPIWITCTSDGLSAEMISE